MKMDLDLRYVSAVAVITSLLLGVNPDPIGSVGVLVAEFIHFFILCFYGIVAVGFTSVIKLVKTYLDQHSDKVVYDPKNPMESGAAKSLSIIVALNIVVVGTAIYSGWWITTLIVTWSVLTTIAGFSLFAKIKKKEVK
jgi:hypothetical protein